jgi:hypothetical protein
VSISGITRGAGRSGRSAARGVIAADQLCASVSGAIVPCSACVAKENRCPAEAISPRGRFTQRMACRSRGNPRLADMLQPAPDVPIQTRADQLFERRGDCLPAACLDNTYPAVPRIGPVSPARIFRAGDSGPLVTGRSCTASSALAIWRAEGNAAASRTGPCSVAPSTISIEQHCSQTQAGSIFVVCESRHPSRFRVPC